MARLCLQCHYDFLFLCLYFCLYYVFTWRFFIRSYIYIILSANMMSGVHSQHSFVITAQWSLIHKFWSYPVLWWCNVLTCGDMRDIGTPWDNFVFKGCDLVLYIQQRKIRLIFITHCVQTAVVVVWFLHTLHAKSGNCILNLHVLYFDL